MSNPVVIVGAGLSGLTVARELNTAGVDFLILDAADGVGGRVRTDRVDGFQLDRGFQVLLTAYPEARRLLDYDALDLKAFAPGSVIWTENQKFSRLGDPWRMPSCLLQTALSPVGTLADKLRIGRLRARAKRGSVTQVTADRCRSTHEELEHLGFSDRMIESFLRPFLSGVFLEPELATPASMLYFVFRMFSLGDVALPSAGIGAIPDQLASEIPSHRIRLNTPVRAVERHRVVLDDGDQIAASCVVVATEASTASGLVTGAASTPNSRSVRCVYFAAPEPPAADRMLILNGTRIGPVNNLCVPSVIAPGYAPADRALISASVLDDSVATKDLPAAIGVQMRSWFGSVVDRWDHLRTYEIPQALPALDAPKFDADGSAQTRDGVYVVGDHRMNASVNGAMLSGRLTARAVVNEF